jgi:sodium-dependent dicarboxylate transporter 2/3/5
MSEAMHSKSINHSRQSVTIMSTQLPHPFFDSHAQRETKPVLIVAAFIIAGSLYFFLPLEPQLRAGLSILVLVGILWFSEAMPLTFTSLLIPVLAALMDIGDISNTLRYFAHPIIFLFLGGFALAAALSKHKLDSLIGEKIIRQARSQPIYACYAMFVMTAFMSMWISNTATAAMMLPIALGIALRFGENNSSAKLFLLLGMAYSANIGGIATLIGSPPNAIAAATFNLSFFEWLKIGLPISTLLFIVMIWILKWLIKPDLQLAEGGQTSAGQEGDQERYAEQNLHLNSGQIQVVVIFLATVSAWIFSQPLAGALGINSSGFDSLVALSALVILGITGSLSWKEIERNSNWGILLLFGGGLALSEILSSSGTSTFIASGIHYLLLDQPLLITLLLMTACVVFLTEMVSNTASAALLIPLLTGVAQSLGISPVIIAALIAVSASCAFMLPVATPPNAIVYSSGAVPQKTMIKTGFWLNTACIVIISLACFLML